ncbi:MAG: hypothetical protein JWO03_961 [Bacteroidetes bacterium]|nr:hypothetical protein [Bacteroidota bacterium]
MIRSFTIGLFLLLSVGLSAQQTGGTKEDSLQSGFKAFLKGTTIGGYGNAFYQRDFNRKTSEGDLERFVLFIGHKFNKNISIFSELEVEDAVVNSSGAHGGEIALEQAYLKFDVNPRNYFVVGLFLPRIGILNENHLPTSFNGNERTQVETNIIPSTWRELGVGYYGSLKKFPLTWSLAVINGLNASAFEHGSGIREGRFEGRHATFNNMAIAAALQINKGNFKAQISGYYGGTVGAAPKEADSLGLTSGIFGTPVIVGEADVQYRIRGFNAKIMGTILHINDAAAVNRAFANNTPSTEYGVYGEVGYDILTEIKKANGHQLVVFVRYEKLNMNVVIPDNGVIDGTLDQQHIVTGLSYLPIKNVIIKTDVRFQHTGAQNPALVFNPSPVALPYQQNNIFLNLGVGYSF